MRTIGRLSALLVVAAMVGFAQSNEPLTLDGYVVDQHCAKGMATKANAMEKAATHTKSCLLMDDCSGSGYGIFSGGKYYPFDEKGSATAKSLIEKSNRANEMYFEAKGKIVGGKLMFASLKEATLEKGSGKSGDEHHKKSQG
jgi:hypothetical protein